jgi:hypothetical protein
MAPLSCSREAVELEGERIALPARGRRAWGVPVTAALVATTAVMAMLCRFLLLEAGGHRPPFALDLPFYVGACVFLLAATAVVVVQTLRVSRRVSAPELRLIQSLRRIRSGDLAFRVHLRRGDLLTDLASECNALIDHLNANPPVGSLTGTDLLEIGAIDGELVEPRP